MPNRTYVADDAGKVCTWEERDPWTGCCEGGEQHICERCTKQGCCDVFEQCVSCCLGRAEQMAWKDQPRIIGRPDKGEWNNPFDFCSNACRTKPGVTVHENAYRSTYRFCFNQTDEPPLHIQQESNTTDPTVTVVAGVTGQNCNDACGKAGKTCLEEMLAFANDCGLLERYFGCTGGCQIGSSPWMPAFTPGKNAKGDAEYVCRLGVRSSFNCSSMSFNSNRVCACRR